MHTIFLRPASVEVKRVDLHPRLGLRLKKSYIYCPAIIATVILVPNVRPSTSDPEITWEPSSVLHNSLSPANVFSRPGPN